MKQTSSAIALLIANVSALSVANQLATGYQNGSPVWQPKTDPTNVSNSQQLQSRTAPFAARNIGSWTWTGSDFKRAILAATYDSAGLAGVLLTPSTTTSATPSSCMACIGAKNVWCSRTYSFNIKIVNSYQQDATAQTSAMNAIFAASDDDTWFSSLAKDQGSCCNSNDEFLKMTGKNGTASVPQVYAVGTSTTAGALDNSQTYGSPGTAPACVAFLSAPVNQPAAAWGPTTWELGTTAWTSWWCSNGTYKTVTVSSGAPTITSNTIQTIGQADNSRQELAFVGCPQIQGRCGGDSAGVTSLTSTQVASPTVINVLATSVLTINDKCTWVATAWDYAPTFVMSNGTAATNNLGLVTSNWTIHHMEYITSASSNNAYAAKNGLLVQTAATTTAGTQQTPQALGYGNYVPKLIMEAQQFATLRTWYGTGLGQTNNLVGTNNLSVYGSQSAQWFAPYANAASATTANQVYFAAINNTQFYGNVANIPASSIANNSSAANLTAGQNYGNNATTYFDFRVVRYMPASAAQTVWAAGSTLNTSYTSATTSYATAKTTWNAYVAILKKNAKMDAFAAAFSPPKAPTVPPLPNMPWTPPAYSGYLKQTPEQNTIMLQNQTGTVAYVSAAQPTNQQFWTSLDAAQTIGGWGSWTASIIQYRNGWGKSFGTIGYSPGTQSMSQLWSYKQMCGTANIALGKGPTFACDKTYAVTANASVSSGSIDTAANSSGAAAAWQFVTVISLWSNGNTNTPNANAAQTAGEWTGKQSLTITWTPVVWGNTLQQLGAITPPTPPTAADSLTGVAGASALAASSAAVLAIAALY